jgi:SAM-dependent methyltransferase
VRSGPTDAEAFFRAFHAARPAATSRALERAGSDDRLAARVPEAGRVLDLACGDGPLLRRLGPRAVGIDLAEQDVTRCAGRAVQGRAQQLPFATGAFAAATCHLAFMLFDDVELVVAELHRVLAPGAPFLALLGGGPTASGSDAFHALAEHVPRGRSFGDPRARSEAGWCELFADGWHDIAFERWELDMSGTFDEVWQFLGASYQLGDESRVREAVRARFPGERVPCAVATYFARVTRQ